MFYERFLALCKSSNIAPSTAATKAGFNRGTVSVWKKKYESGQDVTPAPDVIDKICVMFGCTEQWLRGISEDKEKAPTPESESGRHVNVVTIAGRDGSYKEKRLTDEQIKALQTIIDQMPEAPDDL